MKDTLNENIKELRQAAGMNQVEFARLMNVSKQCVSNWENDNVQPSVEMLCKLAAKLGVTTDALLGRDTSPTLDVAGLTEEQVAHVRLIVCDLRAHNLEEQEDGSCEQTTENQDG